MTDDELKYLYKNRKGKVIYTPIYLKYNELFTANLLAGTAIKSSFEKLKDTSLYERFMLNSYQFSAAKSAAEAMLIQHELFDEKGNIRSFSRFKKAAREVTDISQETWLRVEYDNSRRMAVQAQQFTRMREDADLYPYWVYHGVMDSRERPEHVAMEGKVFKIGDPAGDACFPFNDWNCRCSGDQIDESELAGRKVYEGESARKILESEDEDGKPLVDPQFRYNPADQGMMPNTGRYFEEALADANAADASLFGIDEEDEAFANGLMLFGAVTDGLHYMVRQYDAWRRTEHTDMLDNIILQNQALMTNVRFPSNVLHTMHKHPRGFNNLPDTVKDPDEVWMTWKNADEQRTVLRNYCKFDERSCYVVQTENGSVTDAFLVSEAGAEKYRKGVPWLK